MPLPIPELELENAGGTIYPLEWPGRHVMEVSGLGMPPIVHWTTRSPFQHGRTHWGYAWEPRVINMILFLRGCNRTGMWEGRAANIAMLNPAEGPHKLRLTYPNGEAFELHDVWFNAGYTLSSADQTWSTQIGDVQLVVNDPFWKWITAPLDAGETRDADGRTCVETSTWVIAAAMVLPFTGPYLMGTSPGTATLTATNDGSVAVKPVITIEGPTEDWVLSNGANNDYIYSDGYSLAAGEILTIDVPAKTATSSVSGDMSTYLRGDTASFELDPGANALTMYSSGGAVHLTTTLGVCWYLEVLGV